VLVDLPGVQRPRDALTERMASRLQQEVEGADAALLVLAGDQRIGAGDRFLARSLADAGRPVTIALNKVDRLSRPQQVEALTRAAELEVGDDIFPISARRGTGVAPLVEHLLARMPAGPLLFDAGEASDQPREVMLAELVREAVVRRTLQEVPHAVEVVIEDVDETRPELTVVRALVWVETESQKGILIGARGRMIKAIGSAARGELERELGRQVHLDLSVRVRRGWRSDDALLDRLGIN
jgi:GTPase